MSATEAQDVETTGDTAGDRTLGPALRSAAGWIALAFAVFHLYTAAFGNLPSLIQRSVHVGFALVLVFLLFSARGRGGRTVAAVDWLLLAVSLAATAW
ncbi:MAG: TRAP transporter permease, partial [Alphaproteobacteria bacterium]|nr:TRAP transporter permease [Alphaproteobacteria bacterium]